MTFSYTRRAHLCSLVATLGLGAAGQAVAAASAFDGTWTGLLEAGATRLTLRLVVAGDTVNLISVDQGEAVIPASEVAITAEHIRLVFKTLNGSFEGRLTADDFIDGIFTQGQAFHMRLARGEAAVPSSAWRRLTPHLLNERRVAAATPAIGAAWTRGKQSDLIVRGVRSNDDEIASQSSDRWHWGSITKSMTATLCARLVEAGVIRWDTSIGQVLDDPGAAVPQAYREATLLHLLSHCAGLQPDVTGMETGLQPDITGMEFSYELKDAREERVKFARAALAMTPANGVGKKMVYSNNGYVVAGAMLEKLTGIPWETLIQTEVFKPLGIKRAGQGAPGRKGRIDQPLGHAVTNGKRIPHQAETPGSDNVVASGPAGRVHMPLADMLAYLAAHRDRPAKFLKAESWSKLHTPPFGGNYALGWFRRVDGALWHNGSNTMWYGEVMVDHKGGVVCAACANDATPETRAAVSDILMSAYGAAAAGTT